ncbi:lysophospholipid acyltransferase family protein [Pseudomonadota bacterium]
MKLHKRILNQDWAQSVVTWTAAAYLKFVRATGRWETRDWDKLQKLIDEGKPVILCFWHGRLIANIFGWPKGVALHQLSTAHRDGQLAGKTYQRLGVTPIWLDKNKPTEATRQLVKILKAGGIGAITPDGPKGPRQRMQSSAIDIIRLAGGGYLVPVSNSTNKAKILGTWDKMQLPLPFGGGIFQVGEPVEVPRKASSEELEVVRLGLEDALNTMTRELDELCGQDTPEPAPIAEDAP